MPRSKLSRMAGRLSRRAEYIAKNLREPDSPAGLRLKRELEALEYALRLMRFCSQQGIGVPKDWKPGGPKVYEYVGEIPADWDGSGSGNRSGSGPGKDAAEAAELMEAADGGEL